MVWASTDSKDVRDEVAALISQSAGNAFFERGHPVMVPASYQGPGSIIHAVFTYNAQQPLSASDFEEVMRAAGVDRYEGVAINKSDEGIAAVEFGGV